MTIPVNVKNARLKLALAIPTGTLITVRNNTIPPLVADKRIKDLSK